MNRAILTAAMIAIASPTLAGGIAGGYDAPRGTLDFSVGRSHTPDRDRISDSPGCARNRILCPREGSDWWDRRERSRDLLREIAKPEPEPQPPVIARPEPEPEAPPAVPLPAAGWIMALGLALLWIRRRA